MTFVVKCFNKIYAGLVVLLLWLMAKYGITEDSIISLASSVLAWIYIGVHKMVDKFVPFRDQSEIKRLFKDPIFQCPAGSRATCTPVPEDTDEDWLVYCRSNFTEVHEELEKQGFELGGSVILRSLPLGSVFRSYIKKDLNLIITDDIEFYDDSMKATRLAKRMNILNKSARVVLFQYILCGVSR